MKKSIKTAMFAFAVVAAGFGGLKAYNAYSDNESTLMIANIEALSQDNGGDGANSGNFNCPKKDPKPKFCTQERCFSLASDVHYADSTDLFAAEGHVEFTYKKVDGLKDRCPNRGSGCNPYSCQFVAYPGPGN